jgi:hypothetical protein
VLDIEFLEGEIDHRARRLGGKALAPVIDAEPVAEFGCARLAPVDADHADGLRIALDQERGLAAGVGLGTDEMHGVIVRIGVRQAARVFRNAAVIGEVRNGFYVRERRPAQRQPLGLEDARSGFSQCRGRDVVQHVGLLYAS